MGDTDTTASGGEPTPAAHPQQPTIPPELQITPDELLQQLREERAALSVLAQEDCARPFHKRRLIELDMAIPVLVQRIEEAKAAPPAKPNDGAPAAEVEPRLYEERVRYAQALCPGTPEHACDAQITMQQPQIIQHLATYQQLPLQCPKCGLRLNVQRRLVEEAKGSRVISINEHPNRHDKRAARHQPLVPGRK